MTEPPLIAELRALSEYLAEDRKHGRPTTFGEMYKLTAIRDAGLALPPDLAELYEGQPVIVTVAAADDESNKPAR